MVIHTYKSHTGIQTYACRHVFWTHGDMHTCIHAAFAWRIHCGVEVTELSTNKQHTLSLYIHIYILVQNTWRHAYIDILYMYIYIIYYICTYIHYILYMHIYVYIYVYIYIYIIHVYIHIYINKVKFVSKFDLYTDINKK